MSAGLDERPKPSSNSGAMWSDTGAAPTDSTAIKFANCVRTPSPIWIDPSGCNASGVLTSAITETGNCSMVLRGST